MPTFKKLEEQFEAANPDIDIRLIGQNNYNESTQFILRNAMTGRVPDVVHQGYGRASILLDRDMAADLPTQIHDNPDDLVSKSSAELCEREGKILCIPVAASIPVVFYNKALVEFYNDAPSWSEILSQTTNANSENKDVMGGYFRLEGAGSYPMEIVLGSLGERISKTHSGTISLGGASSLAPFEIVEAFRKSGMIDMSRSQAIQQFAAGKMGVMVMFSSYAGGLKDQIGERFELGIVATPRNKQNNATVPTGGSVGMILTREPSRQEAAWKWLVFFRSPAAQALLAQETGNLPVIRLPNAKPYKEEHNNRLAELAQEALPRSRPPFSGFGSETIEINIAIEDALLATLRAEKTPAEALTELQKELSAYNRVE